VSNCPIPVVCFKFPSPGDGVNPLDITVPPLDGEGEERVEEDDEEEAATTIGGLHG